MKCYSAESEELLAIATRLVSVEGQIGGRTRHVRRLPGRIAGLWAAGFLPETYCMS